MCRADAIALWHAMTSGAGWFLRRETEPGRIWIRMTIDNDDLSGHQAPEWIT